MGAVGTYRYILLKTQAKIISRKIAPTQSSRMLETIYGCKWSLTVFQLLSEGINRPGEMVRSVDGLTTKVLNTCLRRNQEFGILERISYNEVPPRVEYKVTPFGAKFMRILDEIENLQSELDKEN